MTTPHPLPAEGGSYLRHPDGSLERIDQPEAEAQLAPMAPMAPIAAEDGDPIKPEKAPKTSVKGA